jgi:hypothetical protein
MLLVLLASLLLASAGGDTLSVDEETPPDGDPCPLCLPMPPYTMIPIPAAGVWRLGTHVEEGWATDLSPCDETDSDAWIQASTPDYNWKVCVTGPNGSGRYWDITILIEPPLGLGPRRGVELLGETRGLVNLEVAEQFKLPWVTDLDEDGRSEFILWKTFPPSSEVSPFQTGLIGWVYRPLPNAVFTLDLDLTRRLARSLAEMHRRPFNSGSAQNREHFERLATELERFAADECYLRVDPSRLWYVEE